LFPWPAARAPPFRRADKDGGRSGERAPERESPVPREYAWPDVPVGNGGTKMERRASGLWNVRSSCFSNAGIVEKPGTKNCDVRRNAAVPRRQQPSSQPLLKPEIHAHLAVARRRGGQILPRVLRLADAVVELGQAEMTVCDERAHAVQLGECKRLPVVGCAAFGIEFFGMGRDVPQQLQRMGRKARLALRGFNGTTAQATRLVEPAEQETGATRRVVGPAAMTDDPPRRLTFEKLLTLPRPAQRLAGLADLSQRPGGSGDRPGNEDGDIQNWKFVCPVFGQ